MHTIRTSLCYISIVGKVQEIEWKVATPGWNYATHLPADVVSFWWMRRSAKPHSWGVKDKDWSVGQSFHLVKYNWNTVSRHVRSCGVALCHVMSCHAWHVMVWHGMYRKIHKYVYSIFENICALFCFVVVKSPVLVNLCDVLTHIGQGCFARTCAVVW